MEENSGKDVAERASTLPTRILRSLGPGLVTACVVIGPGSILTSSKVGSSDGYSKVWVVVLAVFFMMIYITLATRLGVVAQQSTGDLVTKRVGRWVAVVIGVSVFFISAAFQFGNNLGVHSALVMYADFDYWVVAFNAVSILFVFAFRNLYRIIERLMACLVGLMLISFALNLWFAQPQVERNRGRNNSVGRLVRDWLATVRTGRHNVCDHCCLFPVVSGAFQRLDNSRLKCGVDRCSCWLGDHATDYADDHVDRRCRFARQGFGQR